MIIEGNLAVVAVMQAMAVLVDHHVVVVLAMMVMSMGLDDQVTLGCRSE
ncbi:hypothetical protein [Mesorhizobium shangrilense]|uniref:Uncharacterized protein n=1 Tax=Mesorhizobium shangrilense TaxID=460060 RepID=A0ABV2DQ64_9HYPH